AQAAAYRLRGAQIRSALRPRTGACSVRGKTVSTKWTARIQHRRAVGAFPAAIAACTLAAFGGQRGALTTLRNGPSAPTRRALGAFPAAIAAAPLPRSVANAVR